MIKQNSMAINYKHVTPTAFSNFYELSGYKHFSPNGLFSRNFDGIG